MLTLRAPERTDEQLRALAASGRSGFARSAQDELARRKVAMLRSEVEAAVNAIRAELRHG